MKAITTNAGAIKLHLNGQLIRTVPKGSFTTQIDWKRESVVISMNGTTTYYDFPLGTTIDGNDPGTLEDLADALSAFSKGGGAPGEGVQSVNDQVPDGNGNVTINGLHIPVIFDNATSVQGALDELHNHKADRSELNSLVHSVTGDLVDNTDPNNPIIVTPDSTEIQHNGILTPNGGTAIADVGTFLNNYANTINAIVLRVPLPPDTGSFVLTSVDGVVSWVEDE